jgi:transcriptional regulator with XRE-family HTH domain
MKPSNTQYIATNTRRLRESKSYSQEYMAAKLGLGQNGYSKIELNQTRLTVERLLMIALLLEIDPAALIQSDENKAA